MAKAAAVESVTIKAPNFKTGTFKIVGTTPLVVRKKDNETIKTIADAQKTEGRSKTTRGKAKDFDRMYHNAFHRSTEGWYGFPASAFRAAMIDACRFCDYKMNYAKMSIFIVHDGIDDETFQPLVRIVSEEEPIRTEMQGRNKMGGPVPTVRPMWKTWGFDLRVEWDADQFKAVDIANLLYQAGKRVGVGEGRNMSRDSVGLGWGCFTLATDTEGK